MSQLYRLAPLFLVAFGVVACIGARPLEVRELTDPGPGLWPVAVAALVIVTAAVLVFADIPEDYESWDRNSLTIAAGVATLAAFIVFFQVFGFIISAFLMLTVWLRGFAKESWRLSLVLAVVGTAVMYLLFGEFFAVPFPEGVFVSQGEMRI